MARKLSPPQLEVLLSLSRGWSIQRNTGTRRTTITKDLSSYRISSVTLDVLVLAGYIQKTPDSGLLWEKFTITPAGLGVIARERQAGE